MHQAARVKILQTPRAKDIYTYLLSIHERERAGVRSWRPEEEEYGRRRESENTTNKPVFIREKRGKRGRIASFVVRASTSDDAAAAFREHLASSSAE